MERMVSPVSVWAVAGRALRLLFTRVEPLFVRDVRQWSSFSPLQVWAPLPRSSPKARWVYVLSLVSLLLPDAQECPTGASRAERRTADSFAAKSRARAARIFGALGA